MIKAYKNLQVVLVITMCFSIAVILFLVTFGFINTLNGEPDIYSLVLVLILSIMLPAHWWLLNKIEQSKIELINKGKNENANND